MRNSLALQALLAGVEAGLNRTLRLDPQALAALGALQGKVIAFQCRSPSFEVFVLPAADGIHLAAHHEPPVDCRLIAPASALVRLATQTDKSKVLHEPDVTLEGDSGPLLALSEIMQSLNLDWEHGLSGVLGPVATGLLGRTVRAQAQWTRRSVDHLHHNVEDYLTEEARTLVGRREAESRFTELDNMTLKLDRLEARLERLARHIRGRSESA